MEMEMVFVPMWTRWSESEHKQRQENKGNDRRYILKISVFNRELVQLQVCSLGTPLSGFTPDDFILDSVCIDNSSNNVPNVCVQ